MRPLLLILAVSLAGCVDESPETDDGETCSGAVLLALDPVIGACRPYAPDCGNAEIVPGVPNDQLATCHSACDELDESTCLDTAGCRAGYELDGTSTTRAYWTCWATAPSDPDHTTACAGLSAQACSRRDDCVAIYDRHDDSTTTFDACGSEPGV